MNIQAISGMNFMANPAQIKRVTPLSEYTENLLGGAVSVTENVQSGKLIDVVAQKAKDYGRDVVKIAQNGDMLLINSGNLTSAFKTEPAIAEKMMQDKELMNDVSKSLYDTFLTNIKGNVIAEERGLKKGIEYIEINTPPETVGSKLNTLA